MLVWVVAGLWRACIHEVKLLLGQHHPLLLGEEEALLAAAPRGGLLLPRREGLRADPLVVHRRGARVDDLHIMTRWAFNR
jgi:hypothetical protein